MKRSYWLSLSSWLCRGGRAALPSKDVVYWTIVICEGACV